MNINKAKAIMDAAAGLSWTEWRMICEMIDRKFCTRRNALQFTADDAKSAYIALMNEMPKGENNVHD